jgi:hypothetical protein
MTHIVRKTDDGPMSFKKAAETIYCADKHYSIETNCNTENFCNNFSGIDLVVEIELLLAVGLKCAGLYTRLLQRRKYYAPGILEG